MKLCGRNIIMLIKKKRKPYTIIYHKEQLRKNSRKIYMMVNDVQNTVYFYNVLSTDYSLSYNSYKKKEIDNEPHAGVFM